MRITYGVQTEDEVQVRGWFRTVDDRLRTKQGVMIGGDAKKVAPGLYVVTIETAVDMLGFLVGPLMLMGSGVMAWVFWRSVTWSNWLVYLGLAGMVVVYALVAPGIHRLLMRVTLRRLTGRWVSVKPATQEALWRLTHGKV